MRVLSVTSECAPLVKTGGLADVAGALPRALAGEGVTLRTLLPGYPSVMAALTPGGGLRALPDLFGGPARLVAGTARGLDLIVLDAPHLFDRPGSIYLGEDGQDQPDNPERFAALSWAAAELATDGLDGWQPEVVHAHDWQGALAPYYLRQRAAPAASVLTIHNIAFQGLAPADRLARLRLSAPDWHPGFLEYYGRINVLKAGLLTADRITTVSPTYARELLTPAFGMGLEGVLATRRDVLTGVLNGLDLDAWDPARDTAIVRYTEPGGKAANRAALIEEFGLRDGGGPLCVVISRLTEQKGLDLLLQALPALLARGGSLALLGSGSAALEAAWRAAGADPAVGVRIGYDEAMSRRLLAGGDAVLVPSRFEPCGLTQLQGLRYGTVPVVALTGGLADTVIPASPAGLAAGVATGLHVHPLDAATLAASLDTLCDLHADGSLWDKLRSNGMAHPVGWVPSAARYASLYRSLTTA